MCTCTRASSVEFQVVVSKSDMLMSWTQVGGVYGIVITLQEWENRVPTLAEIVAYAERVLLCLHQQLTLGHLLITPSNFTTRDLLHEAMHFAKHTLCTCIFLVICGFRLMLYQVSLSSSVSTMHAACSLSSHNALHLTVYKLRVRVMQNVEWNMEWNGK